MLVLWSGVGEDSCCIKSNLFMCRLVCMICAEYSCFVFCIVNEFWGQEAQRIFCSHLIYYLAEQTEPTESNCNLGRTGRNISPHCTFTFRLRWASNKSKSNSTTTKNNPVESDDTYVQIFKCNFYPFSINLFKNLFYL